jgi:tetratricopeptide (TPR) repeat protein
MNAPVNLSAPRMMRHSLRLLISGILILVAFFAVRVLKNLEYVLAKPNVTVSTPSEILAPLPTGDIQSNTGKALAASLLKTRAHPEEVKNWIVMGDTFAQLQRETEDSCYFAAAEAVYTEALRLAPKNASALAGMAWVYGGRHQFDQSIAWGNQTLGVDPECVEALGILGDAALELGHYDDAFKNYQKMMDLRPNLSSWSRGAHLLWLTGEVNQAKILMGKAIAAGAPFAENTGWCRIRMATMLFHEGAIPPAEDAIRPLLKSGSKNSHLLLLAARIAGAKGDMALAEEYYHSLLVSGPNQHASAGLGDLMANQGKTEEAERYYQIVETLHTSVTKEGGHDHGFMSKFLADHDRNLLEALRMVEEHKLTNNVQELDTLAWVYYKNKMMPQAIDAIKRALRLNSPDPEIHYHAGMIASAYGDFTSARKHLEKALAMNSEFSLTQAPLAVAELLKLDQRKAVTHAEVVESTK